MKWNPNLYDKKHDFVSQYGSAVLSLLAPTKGEEILDVGCGTGDLANQIDQTGATVYGMDPSPEMIERAREKFPKIDFEVGDARDFTTTRQFDAVFSNATLHWIPKQDHPKVLQEIKNHLRPEGRLVAEMGGGENVKSIRVAIQEVLQESGFKEQAQTKVWFFPTPEEYKNLLEKAGFEVAYIELLKRPTPLRNETGIENWLQMFGEKWFHGVPKNDRPEIIKAIRARLYPQLYHNGTWVADYERLRFKAINR